MLAVANAPDLEISIKNTGSTDCVLKRQYPVFSHVSDHTKVPEVIFRDQTVAFSMRSDINLSLRTAIIVTYECGDEQEITLLSTLSKTGFEHKVFDAKNMQASATTEDSGSFSSLHRKIHWVLKNQP